MELVVATTSHLPWDTSKGNRLVHYSSEDHSAPLWIVALLALIYSVGVLVVRISIKLRVFGWDDYAISASTAFALSHFILIYSALENGLGRMTESVPDIQLVSQLVHTSQVLFLVSLYLTKLSILLLLRRLFVQEQRTVNLLCHVTIGITILGGIASVAVGTLSCYPSVHFAQHCQNQNLKWVFITVSDITTEILQMLLPPCLVWQLPMRIQNKLRVVVAFSFRLIVIALSILHLNALQRYATGTPSSIHLIPSIILQEVLLATALITATIPNMRAFVQSLSGSWGDPNYVFTRESTKYSGSAIFELKNMKSTKSEGLSTKTADLHLVPNSTVSETRVDSSIEEQRDRGSLERNGSQDMIIRKKMAWKVERS